MMKRMMLTVLALIFAMASVAYAAGGGKQAPKAESFNEMFSKGTANGEYRVRWFKRTFAQEGRTDWNTFATGGELHFQTAPLAGVSAGVGFYTVQDFGWNSEDDEVYYAMIGKDDDGNPEETTSLGEYFVNYHYSKTDVTFGAQEIVTAWLKKWDTRVAPKTHEALMFRSREIDDLEVVLGHVWRVKNNASEDFIFISDDMKGVPDDEDQGVSLVELKYNGFSGFNTYLAYHHFHNAFSNSFFNVLYNYEINDNVKWFAQLRYDYQKGVGDELFVGEDFETYFYGGQFGFEYHGATLIGSYSSMGDQALAKLDGHSKLIQMHLLGNAQAEQDAYRFDLEYKLHKIIKPLKGAKIMFSYAHFDSPESGKNAFEDFDEYDIDFKYVLPPGPFKGWDIRLRYANLEGSDSDKFDWEDYRLYLTYKF